MVRRIIKHPFYSIVYLSFILFVLAPIVYTIGQIFFGKIPFIENLQSLNLSTFSLLAKSSLIAFIVAGLSTIIGSLLGFLLYKTTIPFRRLFKIILLIPLFISPYILAVAWKDFFFLSFNSTELISSYAGVILVLTLIYSPLAMIIIGNALININADLEESGFTLTSASSVIFKIVLPLIKPALITSFVLIFIFSISEFSVPAFFGLKVFTTEIFTQFSAFYNYSLAVLQSLFLVLICVLLLLAEKNYIADAPFLSIGSKGIRTIRYNFKKRNRIAFSFILFWFFISIMLPFGILIIQSFQDGSDAFIKAFYLLKPTFINSISLASVGALITIFIGFMAAYFTEIKKKKSFNWILLFLFAIPSIILGISLIKFYNHPILNFIYSSSAIILIGYVAKFSFIASKLIGNAIKQIPISLDEAAKIEGVNHLNRVGKIIIPLALPSIIATFIIVFIFNIGELGTTIMVYPPGTEIMPIKVFTIMANAPQSLVSSMTLIVFSLTLLLIIGLYFVAKVFIKNRLNTHD